MISLAELEREVARRTGPFFQAAQDSGTPSSSTATSAIMPSLKTNALLGGPENLWLVRRGRTIYPKPSSVNWRGEWQALTDYFVGDGVTDPPDNYEYVCIKDAPMEFPTPDHPGEDPEHWQLYADLSRVTVTPQDRERLVQTFDSGAGRVIVDRNWRDVMYPGELADFMHLHPSQELRVAVLAGLRRCFFEDTFGAEVTSGYGDMDLTSQQPWITSPEQVMRVQYGWMKPWGDAPFEAFMQQGHVMLGGAWGGYAPASVWVTALHPHVYWVNGANSNTGPSDDEDTLSVDLDYAAAAGHIEAWHLFPSRMFAAAAGNLQATQEMAAREFTRQAMIWGPTGPRRYGFSEVVRLPSVG